MATTDQDFDLYSGEVRQIEFSLFDFDADPSGNTPLDITGATLKWGASRVNQSGGFSTTPAFEKCSNLTSPNQIIITDASNGQGNFTINPVDTSSLSGELRHQMAVVTGGEPVVVWEGTIALLRKINQVC